jgi:hypothetical protein
MRTPGNDRFGVSRVGCVKRSADAPIFGHGGRQATARVSDLGLAP